MTWLTSCCSHTGLTTPAELRASEFKDPCPAELEYFKHIDQLVIKQVKEVCESKTSRYVFVHTASPINEVAFMTIVLQSIDTRCMYGYVHAVTCTCRWACMYMTYALFQLWRGLKPTTNTESSTRLGNRSSSSKRVRGFRMLVQKLAQYQKTTLSKLIYYTHWIGTNTCAGTDSRS